MLLVKSPAKLTIAALTADIAESIEGVQERAQELAEEHTDQEAEFTDKELELNRIAIEAAAAALAAALVRSTHYRLMTAEEGSYREAAEHAARDNTKRIATTADTEFYRAYNDAWIAVASPDALLRWNAVLDKRTCPRCDRLDGTTVKASKGFPSNPPLHPRCRCFVDLTD